MFYCILSNFLIELYKNGCQGTFIIKITFISLKSQYDFYKYMYNLLINTVVWIAILVETVN